MVAAMRLSMLAAALSVLLFAGPAQAQSLRDPTVPLLTGNAASTPDALSETGFRGVLQSPPQPLALIDGQALKVGQQSSLGRITRITPDAVYVRSENGQVERVSLYPAVSMQPAASAASPARDFGKGGKK